MTDLLTRVAAFVFLTALSTIVLALPYLTVDERPSANELATAAAPLERS